MRRLLVMLQHEHWRTLLAKVGSCQHISRHVYCR
jgi:hypothetical protein